MSYKDLRDFLTLLEDSGELKRIQYPANPYLEITEICDRTLKQKGPALLFETPKNSRIPLLGNLFGSSHRVALGMGAQSISELREVGKLLAYLKEPEPPKGMKDAVDKLPVFKKVLHMAPKIVKKPKCQEVTFTGSEVDLS